METEPQIIANYVVSGDVKIVYRHLLQLGGQTERVAEASECAADQGRFWEMRTALYERQSELYRSSDLDATLTGIATDLGMDGAAFSTCMQNNTHLELVRADFRAAQQAGVQARPVFDINGQRLIGPRRFEEFQQLIEAGL